MQNDENPETQGQILKAAMQHFAEHGYRGASISKIAEEAKVSKSLIFWYFESKNGLFQSLVDYFVRSCKETLANTGPAGDARAKIENMIDTYWDFIGRNLSFVRIFMNWFMHLEPKQKENASLIRSLQQEFRQIFADYLQEGIAQGIFRKDLDIPNTAFFLVSTLEGLLLQLLIDGIHHRDLKQNFLPSLKVNLMDGLLK